MKFSLGTIGSAYSKDEKDKLMALGFRFRREYENLFCIEGYEPEIELNSLEELVNFTNRYGQVILEGNEMTFYDDYAE